MAIVSTSANVYSTIGQREELSDLISLITPTDTPLIALARKGKVTNTKFEWQTDQLASTLSLGTGALEGDTTPFTTNVSALSFNPTVRLANYTQITNLGVNVTGTEEEIKKAGRGKDEMAYQLGKKAKELKRNMEVQLVNNHTYNVGNATTGRLTRGLYGWLDINASVGGGTSALGNSTYATAGITLGVFVNPWSIAALTTPTSSASLAQGNNYAPVNGTSRPFSEALLMGVLQSCYYSGGNPDTIMLNPYHRSVFSSFTGTGSGGTAPTRFDDSSDKRIYQTVSIYESDFGTLKAVPNRFIDTSTNSKTVYVLESDGIGINYLRDSAVIDLAITGDYQSKMLLSEYGLAVDNPQAHGTIRDLQ